MFAELLRSRILIDGDLENARQRRQRPHHGRRDIAELFEEGTPGRLVGFQQRDQSLRDAVQQRQRPLGRVGDALPRQHRDAGRMHRSDRLGQEPALSTPGVRFQPDQTAVPVGQSGDQRPEHLQLSLPPDEDRIGETDSLVQPADHQPRFAVAGGDSRQQVRQICGHRGGRLIPLGRGLAQQPLDQRVHRTGHRDVQMAQFRYGHAQMLTEQIAHGRTWEGWVTGEAFEEQHAERVQVRALVGRGIQQAGGFRCQVADRADQVVPDRLVQPGATSEAEIDQGHGDDRVGALDHDVGRLDVSVTDTDAVRDVQGRGDVQRDAQRGRERQRPRTQLMSQGRAGDQRLDEEQPTLGGPAVPEAR